MMPNHTLRLIFTNDTVDYSRGTAIQGSGWMNKYGEAEEKETFYYNWPVLCFFTIVVLTILGNVLVCLAVKLEKKLRNMFNYFLVSLALSDMLSATLVMPLSIIKALIGMLHIYHYN